MDNARQQIVDSLKKNSNILLTVSSDPSVDELSAALGLAIILNNMDKRSTAIFSGAVPPAINFLEPEKTFENSADSLRDFIIALDKEKADHLRYKVDGDLVKIFITPYKTTLSQTDLEFSQGDYNVEMVLALGVKDQDHVDKAIEAQGKILHDATVATITAGADASSLGSIDWHDGTASSLCEMVVGLAEGLKGDQPIFDEQIATALLTGIVSATDRFSNDKTSSRTMTVAAQLMAAGANQQLIAAKLEEAHDINIAPKPIATDTGAAKPGENQPAKDSDGSELTIERPGRTSAAKTASVEGGAPASDSSAGEFKNPQIRDNEQKEDPGQKELENQLANLTAPPTGTLADIEKELLQATEGEKPAGASDPLTSVSDTTMPGFEAPLPTPSVAPTPETTPSPDAAPVVESAPAAEPLSAPVLPPMPEPVLPASPEVTAATQAADQAPTEDIPTLTLPTELTANEAAPEIINQHGAFASPEATSPMNGTLNNPNDGEQTIDPFTPPVLPQTPMTSPSEPVTLTPPVADASSNLGGGTTDGAAILSGAVEPSAPEQPAAAPVSVPELPPLPPLPTDGSLPPLPPPPPPPPAFQPGGAMPAGAVSGDVFGDGNAAAPAADPNTPPPASEPGQFKIPGQ